MAGENYIGSKISLISLSDIRYVGILHSINAQDSTVGLKQVRSFGTEGRRNKPEEEIPPSDNVFDYVVFRASDIKDLQVFEAPPKPAPPVIQDPAIMSMSGYPPMNPYMGNNMYMQSQPPPSHLQPPMHPPMMHPPQVQPPPPNTSSSSSSSSYWQPPYPSLPVEPEIDPIQLEKDTLDGLKAELEESEAMQPSINEAAIEQLAKKVSELTTVEDTPPPAPVEERRRHDHQRRNRHSHNQERPFNKKADFSIPNSEFDFEAANAKFDKNEIIKKEEEVEEIEIPPPDEFYDKSSSFFDNISCESKERNEQRQSNETRRNHFQEERKLNMETFGQATVDQSRYRNNYRRGGYRGRGGYYRNNRNTTTYNNTTNGNYRQNKYEQHETPI